MIEAMWSFKISGTAYPATNHNFPEDVNPQVHVLLLLLLLLLCISIYYY